MKKTEKMVAGSASWTQDEWSVHEHSGLQEACRVAIGYATRYNVDCGVFRAEHGVYMHRELRYCQSEKGEFDVRFVALARLCAPRRGRKKGVV